MDGALIIVAFGLVIWGISGMGKNKVAVAMTDLNVLARTLWGEARGEGYSGMQAVANVIVNRRNDPRTWWGRTIKDICLKPWQFSVWNAGDPNLEKMLNVTVADSRYAMAVDIAQQAINGTLPDITNGSTHYHTNAVRPDWYDASKQVAQIGSHKFYRGIA